MEANNGKESDTVTRSINRNLVYLYVLFLVVFLHVFILNSLNLVLWNILSLAMLLTSDT